MTQTSTVARQTLGTATRTDARRIAYDEMRCRSRTCTCYLRRRAGEFPPARLLHPGGRRDGPFPRGNLIGQLLCLAYPKLAIDKDRLAFSIGQGGRYIPAIGLADEDIEMQCLGRGTDPLPASTQQPVRAQYANQKHFHAEDCCANPAA